jgi:lipopolysaccharide biosynthesis glycosyltransferase
VATLELACAADRAYVPHTAAMLHSVLEHRGALDVRVHFLHGPVLPRRTKRRLARMVERLGGAIDFLEIPDQRVEGLPTFFGITRTMWYRIYLPELLPDVARVLYLDGDILAMDSLEPLWAVELGDHLVAAVTNVFLQDPVARSRPAALGLPGIEAYFNSGVLLLSLEEMRRDGTTAKVRAYAVSHELLFPDQDALNAVMGDRRLRLHPRWNAMNSILQFPWAHEVLDPEQIEEARRRPGLRHFEGGTVNKPWHRDCDQAMREVYFRHRAQTPWPRVRRLFRA